MVAVDAWKPEWQRWTTFGVSRAAALVVDGLQSTRPIEYPVAAPRDADAMFDVLTYEKGASVLRMLEQHIGPEVFREGIRQYLRKHAYGNTETADLWSALGAAAAQSVAEMMDGWVFQPGYPLVSARVEKEGRLSVTQQPFAYLPRTKETPAPQRWQVPIQIRIHSKGSTTTQRLLLNDAEATLDLPEGFECAVLNEAGHGFYRVRYAPELLERLLKLLPNGLAAIERFNLVNDSWAAVLAGLMPLTEYLELTTRFKTERDKNVWAVLIGSFAALNRVIDASDRPAFERLIRDRLQAAFAAVGTPRPGENELTKQLRGELARGLGMLGNDEAVQRQAAAWYAEQTQAPAAADPDLTAAAVAILAHAGDRSRYDEFLGRFRAATTPQDEQRYLHALTAFRVPDLLAETLPRTLNGEFRTQDVPHVIRSLLHSVHGREIAWGFVKQRWDELARAVPATGLKRLCEGVIGLATPELERDVRDFFRTRNIQLGGKLVEQYLEQLHIVVQMREREGEALRAYLSVT